MFQSSPDDTNDDDDNVLEHPDDPFMKHLHCDLGDELLVSLSSTPCAVEKTTKSWPVLGNLYIIIPAPVQISLKTNKPKFSIIENKVYAASGVVPQVISHVDFGKLNLKSQIQGNVVSANKRNLIKKDLEISDIFTPLQKELFSIINNYQDLYCPLRNFSNADEIRYIYCLHVVNHMLKTRTKIIHHNAKLSKKSDIAEEYRDQGLVRPKVRQNSYFW